MEKINKLKIKLKKWEISFVSENNRKPNKDDISVAPDEIRETYKEYNLLKRNVTSNENGKATAEIDPWATTLNKKAICVQEQVKKCTEDSLFMQSIGQKLLAQALSSKTLKSKKTKRLSNGCDSTTHKPNSEERSSDNDDLQRKSIFSNVSHLTVNHCQSPSVRSMKDPAKPVICVKRSHFASTKPIAVPQVGKTQTSVLLDDMFDSNIAEITPNCDESTTVKDLVEQDGTSLSYDKHEQTNTRTNSNILTDENGFHVEHDVDIGRKKGLKRHASKDDDAIVTECDRKRQKCDDTFGLDDDNLVASSNPTDDTETKDLQDIEAASSNTSKPVKRKLAAPPSENFVRLNMKVKKYRCRGISGRTGGYYKRAAWKEKMKSRSESLGNKCFKCGEEGHWANKCKGKGRRRATKEAADWPDNDLQTKVNDADFPSINEAMQTARGIKSGPDTTITAEEPIVPWELDVVRAAYMPPVAPPAAEPMYQLQEDGSVPPTPTEVRQVLKRFGFSAFRKGQEEVVMRVLCGLSTLVVLSTGAGKSLCYQMPAFIYAQRSKCITLVISPLVSLMDDQVTGLPPGIHGACLHGNLSKAQRERVITAIYSGQVHFLLVSPETAVGGGGGGGGLPPPGRMPPIAFACIDEAHCVSEWSHHFRPSYLRICKVLKEKYGVKCILGLTATATMATAASIADHIEMTDYESAVIRGKPMPENLQLSVSRDENKEEAMMQLLQGRRFSTCQSIIIYCTRRQQTTRIATLIRTCLKKPATTLPAMAAATAKKGSKKKAATVLEPGEWNAECYHAGMTASQRRRIQTLFMSGRLRVVVATVAFGMGLDKSDVRGIIHYDMPRRFESYVQEIGRAGRDGNVSYCHLFLQPEGKDMYELKRHIYTNTVDRSVIKKLVRKVFPRCRCAEVAQHRKTVNQAADESENATGAPSSGERVCCGHERALAIDKLVQSLDIKEEGIATLLCYLELHKKSWLQNLLSVYTTCTIQCYGGPSQLQEIARKCPPVAIAIAMEKRDGVSHATCSRLQFDVVRLSDQMGWDSGPVKRELKLLQWNTTKTDDESSKSGVVVEFSDLSFHIRSPGDLSDDEMDEVIGYLTNFLNNQERVELHQLRHLYDTLYKISHSNVWLCTDEIDLGRSDKLKAQIYMYFEQQTLPTESQCNTNDMQSGIPKQICGDLSSVRGDIIAFIQTYSHEHVLTGRSIARVFHGIDSPRFPTEVWGRQRRFWRAYLPVDFNIVRKLAERELVNFK